MQTKAMTYFFHVYDSFIETPMALGDFSKVTLNYVSGLHNCVEFSRWRYVNMIKFSGGK